MFLILVLLFFLALVLFSRSSRIERLHNSKYAKQEKKQVNALLIVDVQYDFIDGTLALKNCPSQHQGEDVIPTINRLLRDVPFDVVVYTQDWHTHDHISFFENLHLRAHLLSDESKPADQLNPFETAIFSLENPHSKKKERVEQILWPAHCVQQSHGAELHKDLNIMKSTDKCCVINLLKGFERDIDSYSGFWDNQKIRETALDSQLKDKHVTSVFIAGIATDVCVFSTALHAVENGYQTFVVKDACRGVDEKNIALRLDELVQRHCIIIQSTDVENFIR
jgi:nicotinamidase-related amidase